MSAAAHHLLFGLRSGTRPLDEALRLAQRLERKQPLSITELLSLAECFPPFRPQVDEVSYSNPGHCQTVAAQSIAGRLLIDNFRPVLTRQLFVFRHGQIHVQLIIVGLMLAGDDQPRQLVAGHTTTSQETHHQHLAGAVPSPPAQQRLTIEAGLIDIVEALGCANEWLSGIFAIEQTIAGEREPWRLNHWRQAVLNGLVATSANQIRASMTALR